jgi:hypothetical protein
MCVIIQLYAGSCSRQRGLSDYCLNDVSRGGKSELKTTVVRKRRRESEFTQSVLFVQY